MKNIELDRNYIDMFAMAYETAEWVFGVEPTQASARKQRKIRKWVYATQIEYDVLPHKVAQYLQWLPSDQDFMEFLKECADDTRENGTWKQQLYRKVAVDFSDEVNRAFEQLFFEMLVCSDFEKQGDKIVLCVRELDNYRQMLVLYHAGETVLESYDYLDFEDAQILRDDKGYRLICLGCDYAQDFQKPITLFFEYAACEIQVYQADDEGRENPWQKLTTMANMILDKRNLGDGYLNSKEQALLPLLKELSSLSTFGTSFEEEGVDYSVLKEYLQKYHLKRMISMLDRYAVKRKEKKNPGFLLSQINARFCEACCEPLWRELYDLLRQSQQSYAKRPSGDEKKLVDIRRRIEEAFHKQGYTGEYPTFRKKGSMKGIHIEENYGQLYFVGAEKNVEYIIQCYESIGEIESIEFMCGTALLRKNEVVEDIYSCCFAAKGRRLIKSFFWNIEEMELLDTVVLAAVKGAECRSLDKEERRAVGTSRTSLAEFLGVFIIFGGLFTIFMMLAMLIMCCLVDLTLFGFSDIPNMLSEMPWGALSIFCFLAFGGLMAFGEWSARHKF